MPAFPPPTEQELEEERQMIRELEQGFTLRESRAWAMGWTACLLHINTYLPGTVAEVNRIQRENYQKMRAQTAED